MTGMFLISLNTTVVARAMTTVVAQLGDSSLFSWVSSVHILTAVASEPISGRLCDVYGRKPLGHRYGFFPPWGSSVQPGSQHEAARHLSGR